MTVPFAQRTSSVAQSSAQWAARAVEVMPGGTTRSTLDVAAPPPYFQSGQGFLVTDVDGHESIDLQNNYTSLVHGHARREIVEAATRALEQGAAVGLPTPDEVEMAELLTERFGLDKVRFANTGTEAVMMALRTARAFSGRHRILRFSGAYHGVYDDVVDGAHDEHDAIVVPHDDPDALRAAIRTDGEPIAAILVDLMPNRAGLRPASDEFIGAVHQVAADSGALIVADEVITARLGYRGYAEARGLRPDLTALGKIIGGGHPVGAFGGRADIMRIFERGSSPHIGHGGTFTANPVTMSAGATAMELFDGAEVQRINSLGERLRAGLVAAGHRVTGYGSLSRLHVEDELQLWWAAYRGGVLIGNNGLLAVSTAMNEPVVDELIHRLTRALTTSPPPNTKKRKEST